MPGPSRSRRRITWSALALAGALGAACAALQWKSLGPSRTAPIAGAESIGADECLVCHDEVQGHAKIAAYHFDCESCHGPGEAHLKARMVAAAKEDESGAKAGYANIPDDEIIKAPTQKTCLECHNDESPGFKPFCFHKRVAEIRHLNPERPRTAEEKAAMLACGCGDNCACKTGCEDGKCGVPPDAKK